MSLSLPWSSWWCLTLVRLHWKPEGRGWTIQLLDREEEKDAEWIWRMDLVRG